VTLRLKYVSNSSKADTGVSTGTELY